MSASIMTRPLRPMLDLSGRCACGVVELALKGEVLSMFLCACEDCQRATGTGHSAAVIARRNAVSISGETRSFSRTADSGAILTRYFCPVCGTPIYAQSSRAPEIVTLPAGLFTGQNDWFAPNQLIFARSHRQWDEISDDIPRHQTYREKKEV
jgi:hypothetical protein